MEHENCSPRAASADTWLHTGVFPLDTLHVLVCYAIDTVCANFLLCSRRKWYKTVNRIRGEVVLYLLCISHSHFLRFLRLCVSLVPGHVARNRRITCSRSHYPWRRFWNIMARKKRLTQRKKKSKPCEVDKVPLSKPSTCSSEG